MHVTWDICWPSKWGYVSRPKSSLLRAFHICEEAPSGGTELSRRYAKRFCLMLRIVGLDLQEMMFRVNERVCPLCTECKIVFLQLPICLCFSFGVSIASLVYVVIHFFFFPRKFSWIFEPLIISVKKIKYLLLYIKFFNSNLFTSLFLTQSYIQGPSVTLFYACNSLFCTSSCIRKQKC